MTSVIKVKEFEVTPDVVYVTDLEGTSQKTAGGIIIPDDDMKAHGIKARWGKVWRVGCDVDFVSVGEWTLIEHGRWTQAIDLDIDGETVKVWRVENAACLLAYSGQERPTDHNDHKVGY